MDSLSCLLSTTIFDRKISAAAAQKLKQCANLQPQNQENILIIYNLFLPFFFFLSGNLFFFFFFFFIVCPPKISLSTLPSFFLFIEFFLFFLSKPARCCFLSWFKKKKKKCPTLFLIMPETKKRILRLNPLTKLSSPSPLNRRSTRPKYRPLRPHKPTLQSPP